MDAVRLMYGGHTANGAEHMIEMCWMSGLECDLGSADAVLCGVQGRRQDIDVLVRQRARDVGQEPIPVKRLNLNRHEERALGMRRPFNWDQALRLCLQTGRIAAVEAVHRNARSTSHEAQNVIPWHRSAALRQFDQQIARPDHPDSAVVGTTGAAPPPTSDDPILVDLIGDGLIATLDDDQPVHYSLRTNRSLANGGIESGDVSKSKESGDRGQMLEGEQPLQRQAALA